jgi:hypothetical protein
MGQRNLSQPDTALACVCCVNCFCWSWIGLEVKCHSGSQQLRVDWPQSILYINGKSPISTLWGSHPGLGPGIIIIAPVSPSPATAVEASILSFSVTVGMEFCGTVGETSSPVACGLCSFNFGFYKRNSSVISRCRPPGAAMPLAILHEWR